MANSLLQVEHLKKVIQGEMLLDDISFSLNRGEILGLIGHNGAGKSLLFDHLSGRLIPDSGRILVDGIERHFASPVDARDAGIVTLFQNVNLMDELSIAENIMLGNLPKRKFARVDWPRMYAEADALLRDIGFEIDSRELVRDLGFLQKRIVELAKALYQRAPIVLLDEPYIGITTNEQATFQRVLNNLKRKQVGIIIISHFIPEILEMCDAVLIMSDGRLSQRVPANRLSVANVIDSMGGNASRVPYPKLPLKAGRPLLELQNVTTASGLRDVSLCLRCHEILGIWGMHGSGKELVGRALFGLEQPAHGRILLDGQPIRFGMPKDAIEHGIGYLPLESSAKDLFANLIVRSNITISNLSAIRRMGHLDTGLEQEAAEAMIDHLYLRAKQDETDLDLLCGGDQQKLRLARRLFADSRILIMDEPTYSIDICSAMDIYNYICNYVVENRAIIIISSNLTELNGLCDRVLILDGGSLAAEFVPRSGSGPLQEQLRNL